MGHPINSSVRPWQPSSQGATRAVQARFTAPCPSRTADYPDEYAPGHHVVLDTRPVDMVRLDRANVLLDPKAYCQEKR